MALAEAAARLGQSAEDWRAAARLFPVRWPPAYLDLAAGASGGPLRAMGVPHADELRPHPDELRDPVGEAGREEAPFVVRKHADRVILLVTAECHFYCRFCFRRSFPDGGHRGPTPAELETAIAHLAGEAELREVILSGGDPLTLSDARLASVLAACAAIPQVTHLRVHSRAPVHEPSRVTPALAALLAGTGKPLRLVTHANHPVEITAAFRAAVRLLIEAGVPVLNQSVLLRGVNDDADVLAALFTEIVEAGVQPYYLHHPDRVPGAARFLLDVPTGLRLMADVERRVPAALLPAYVIDVPDGSGKVPVASIEQLPDGRLRAPGGFEWQDVTPS